MSNFYPKQNGMTLMEILIAMSLLVIISAISYASLNGLIDAKIHTDKVAKDLRQELLTSQQINNDFNAIIDRTVKDQFGAIKPSIIGQYSSIEFSRNGHANPLNQQRAELQRVQWLLRNHKLVRRSLNNLDSGSFPKWQEREYLSNIKEFNIKYFSQVGQESRRWPIPNQTFKLQSVQFTLVLEDNTSLHYYLSVSS